MKKMKIFSIIILLSVSFTLFAADIPVGGTYSAYLIGVYDLRVKNSNTLFEIVNPTPDPLLLLIAFFNTDGVLLKKTRKEIKPNGLVEINTKKEDIKELFGVIKIISYQKEQVKAGIAGYQRNIIQTFQLTSKIPIVTFQTESNMAAINDWQIIYTEFKLLMSN